MASKSESIDSAVPARRQYQDTKDSVPKLRKKLVRSYMKKTGRPKGVQKSSIIEYPSTIKWIGPNQSNYIIKLDIRA